MGTPFMSEIKIISWNFAPQGWTFCDGGTLPINQNQALFSLLGTVFGGNGQTTFGLPDMRGRVPIHMGAGFTLGQAGGQEFHTLTQSEMPAHNHIPQASVTDANSGSLSPPVLLARNQGNLYVSNLNGGAVAMQAPTVSSVGGGQPHENRQPFLALHMIIALQGVFPSQN